MSSAVRLAGVTRSASTTPSRHSAMSPKPAKKAPNTPSWTSIPGTKKVQLLAYPNCAASGSRSGPKRNR